MPPWPDWWHWELELSSHLQKRMSDRGFTEIDLRSMMDDAVTYRAQDASHRYMIETRHGGRAWRVIVEPDSDAQLLVVITAFSLDT